MSEPKLQRYLSSPDPDARNLSRQSVRPVIVSDSKGNYLKPHEDNNYNIIWDSRGGRTTEGCLNWIHDNIIQLLKNHGKIHLFVWAGTCDLTEKNGQTIKLRDNQQEVIVNVKQMCNNIKRLTTDGKNKVGLTFLHVPYYSIGEWNTHKGHAPSELAVEQDSILRGSIENINSHLDILNRELQTHSPKFNADLVRSRKPKNGKIRYSVNHKLLKDGIHPDTLIAKVWMKNIQKIVKGTCYSQ